ncbi:DUF1684 domain-containing protein [Microbacterium sp. No. 7]|uniref:DUF1684 domain-containing protein n=1 Tax=Microbacterium sp. No. 7 TaxID=1714373 RepID=UPI0006D0534A|nr:DUF1684 domain-containing protein [Microbacterium sp. No. 7]ALJ18663.1 hypothetical protein AOA12_01530 [Microbacterium sp. No. 7]
MSIATESRTEDGAESSADAQAAFADEWRQWHGAHEERRTDPHGFFAVTGLHWLTPEPTRFDGIPGTWSTGAEGPIVDLAEGETLMVDGEAATGRRAFGVLAERGGLTVSFEEGVIEIAKRSGHDILRPRRPDHPFLSAYRGTDAFEPQPRWRVPARFVAFDAPRPTEVGAAVDGLTHVYDAPGVLEFAVDGEEYRLTAFPGHTEGFTVLFTDATSGVTTYAANRTVSVAEPDAEGRTVIDFNRAVNLPCAYTDFATCPLPPVENRLPIPVEAGEKTPTQRVRADAPLVAPAGASAA